MGLGFECNGDLSTTTEHSPTISHIMRQTIAVMLWCVFELLPVFSQQIQVNRQNKTIAITADESVSVDPEVATITVEVSKLRAHKRRRVWGKHTFCALQLHALVSLSTTDNTSIDSWRKRR